MINPKVLWRSLLLLALLSASWAEIEEHDEEAKHHAHLKTSDHVLENGRIVSKPVKGPVPVDQVKPSELLEDDSDRSSRNYVAHGDILIPKKEAEFLRSPRIKRKVIAETNRFGTSNRWPRGVVPYDFKEGTDNRVRQNVMKAMQHWHQKTCIRFEPYDAQRHWDINAKITIEDTGAGCATFVGYRPSSDGILSSYSVYLPLVCPLGSAIHELGHVIGFYHEMARTDRDLEILLYFNLMSSSDAAQYDIMPNPMSGYYGQPYDLGSIMHYYPTDVMAARDSRRTFLMGQRLTLSFLDTKLANLAYHCSDVCTSPPECYNEGYVDQFCKCACPDGFYGKQCDFLQGYTATTRSLPTNPNTTTTAPSVGSETTSTEATITTTTTITANASNNTAVHWLEWNEWSNCSESCGSGVRVRTRLCSSTNIESSANPCAALGGDSFEIEACQNAGCHNADVILSCTFDLDNEKCPSKSTKDWHVQKGAQADQTGPINDHTRGDGQYLLLGGKTNRSDDVKPFHLGPFTRTNSSTEKNHCLQFWYSSHETTVGQLTIMKNNSNDITLPFGGKDRDTNWKQIQQTISSDDDYELVFEYQSDTAESHYLAIDDISIIEGACASRQLDNPQRRKRRQASTGCSRMVDLSATNSVAVITSPNYPSLYPSSAQCYYYIRAPQANRVLLQFTDFNIPSSNRNNCDDAVEIRYYHLGQTGPRYCGSGANSNNLRFLSTKNYIMVVLRSNEDFAGRGFRAQVTLAS